MCPPYHLTCKMRTTSSNLEHEKRFYNQPTQAIMNIQNFITMDLSFLFFSFLSVIELIGQLKTDIVVDGILMVLRLGIFQEPLK